MKNIFRFNTHELPRRAGEMREYHLELDLPANIGIDVIAVPKGILHLDLRIESVSEGVLATGKFSTLARGECIRCLDPIELKLDKEFQELYAYKSEDEDQLLMEGDEINLELPIRDAIVLSLPINPVCSDDCEGLCQVCGVKWSELPDDHAHEVSDSRWSALKEWKN